MAANSFPIHDGSSDEMDELNEHIHDPGDPDGIVAAEESQRWQQNSPVPPQVMPQAVYRPKKLWPRLLITLIVLGIAGFGAYWFGNHEATNKQHKQGTTQHQQATQSVVAPTKHYDSSNFTLGLDYPSNWVINDSPSKLTVTSPAMQLTTATGSNTSAHVVVTIQNQQTAIPNFPSGGATAALASDHLTYAQPSSVQRAQTYLSYLSYGTSSNGLDELYITGDNGYQQGQIVPMGDIIKGNPLISVGFESCTDDNCINGKPITLSASKWVPSAVSKAVISTIESIVLQG